MARTDAIVLGAGIVGTSVALHLVKRGLSVALIDRQGAGEATSYGNAGVIEGDTVFPPAFPSSLSSLLRIALKQAPEANYHLSFLPRAAPWLLAFRAASRPQKLRETAHAMRPLFGRAVAEHEALMAEADATRYLRKNGWLRLYRDDRAPDALKPELGLADEFGVKYAVLDTEQTRTLEPSLAPVFGHAVHWLGTATVTNPLALTRAYAARFRALGGIMLTGDVRSMHRAGTRWRVDTDEGPVDAQDAVVALGPWAGEFLNAYDIRLPLAVKRGYHRHFSARGNAGLSRTVVDMDNGYCLAPMEQGIRLTTGLEISARDAAPTPVQFDRLMPAARELFPLDQPTEPAPWLGARPCFADSRPVIGRAPGQAGLWLTIGHAHWGLTLGPATGRLLAEMLTGAAPFCDPAPYRAERFA